MHADVDYLDDIKGLQNYIKDELNVKKVILTTDEEKFNIKWALTADWSVLGRKLRNDVKKVKDSLSDIASDDVKGYIKEGYIVVNGIHLESGDLIPTRDITNVKNSEISDYICHSDQEVVVLLDKSILPEFEEETVARELVNRVQKARKAAGCSVNDKLDVYISTDDAKGSAFLLQVITKYTEMITKSLRDLPRDDSERDKSRPMFYEFDLGKPTSFGNFYYKIILLNQDC